MSLPATVRPDRQPGLRRVGLIGVAILVVLFVVGIAWAKWLPYASKGLGLWDSRTWPGSPIFLSSGQPAAAPSLGGAWQFTRDYFDAIWRAGLVALLVAAGIDALLPRPWLVRVLNRRGRIRQALAGGVLSLPSMMCTCCTAPVALSLRRGGAPSTAGLAYWVGNPLLNPAVLVFLFLVLPWQVGVVRILVGGLLVFAATAVVSRLVEGRSAQAPAASRSLAAPPAASGPDSPVLRQLPGRYLRSLLRLAAVLLPEYVAVVFLTGLVAGWLSDFTGMERGLGIMAWLALTVVGTALVIPTAGEIPVIAGLTAAGAGVGAVGVLLVTLPALSVTSMVMVARAYSWRLVLAMAGAVALAGLAAGGLLVALS